MVQPAPAAANMRVGLLTNLTSCASLPVLERLHAEACFELVHVFFHDTLAEARASPLRVLRQLGLRKVLAKTQRLLAVQFRQRLGGRGQPAELSVLEYARLHHLPCTTIRDANQPQVIDQIRRLELDVLVVAVCKNILRGELLGLPRMFFVNIHPSLLPAYRGPAPTFWAQYHGESQTGVTIHQMTESIDRGAILAQRAVPLDRHRSELEIESELFRLAADDLEGALRGLIQGQPAGVQVNPEVRESYYSYPTAAQRAELQSRLRCDQLRGNAMRQVQRGGID